MVHSARPLAKVVLSWMIAAALYPLLAMYSAAKRPCLSSRKQVLKNLLYPFVVSLVAVDDGVICRMPASS